MNSKFLILTAALAVAMVSSCQKESSHDNTKSEEIQMTFHASFAGATTRTAVQENGTSVWWTPGDRIRIFYGSLASGRFTSTNSDPAQVADFTGTIPLVTGTLENEAQGASFWSVYPYNEDDSCDGESVTLTVSDKQLGAEGTFAQGQFPAIAKASGLDLAFYNVCGGLVFTVASEGIRSVTFEGRQNETVAGTVKVGFNSEGVPAVESVSSGKTFVKLEAPAKGTFTPGVRYFITLLPGTFAEGYTLTFKKDGEEGTLVRTASTTINRSRFRVVENADSSVEYHEIVPDPKNIVFADDLTKAAVVAEYDTDGDGELSYAEAAAVTELHWNDDYVGYWKMSEEAKHCRSFDEFQYFTGLTEIEGCFAGWELLSSIVLPEQLTRIGNYTFSGCKSLRSITVPSFVEYIGYEAFAGCESLASIVLPDSVTEINGRAFNGCKALFSAYLSDNISILPERVFEGCDNLSDLHLPGNLKKIGEGAFSQCLKLRDVTIPQGVETIGGSAFGECKHLRTITLPEGLTTLAFCGVFDGCENLRSIVIPSTLEEIPQGTFRGCTRLNNVEFKKGLKTIGFGAFESCSSLTELVFPEGLTVIEPGAFDNCKNIVSVSFPKKMNEIGERAFRDCSSLVSVSLPDGLFSVASGLFAGCSALESATIPNSVRDIKSSAFSECSNLSSVVLPDTIREIEGYAFNSCSSLSSLLLPKNLVIIGECAFNECTALSDIEIPSGVTSIKESAFAECSNLKLVALPSTLSILGGGAFQSTALESVRIPEKITDIPNNLFRGCKQLKQVYLHENIFRIGEYAFRDCTALEGISLPESLLIIEDGAFGGSGLKSVTVPKYVEQIGGYDGTFTEPLTELIMMPEDPPTFSYWPYWPGITGSFPIYVPNKRVAQYKSADGWSNYVDRIFPISERNK